MTNCTDMTASSVCLRSFTPILSLSLGHVNPPARVSHRRLPEEALRAAQEREDVDQFIRAYTEQPETEEEFGWLTEVSARSLADIPWEP